MVSAPTICSHYRSVERASVPQIGLAFYCLLVGVCVWQSLRAMADYGRSLNLQGVEGPVGYDRAAASRYASKPLSAWREGVLTRSARLLFLRQESPAVERRRRRALVWAIALVASVIVDDKGNVTLDSATWQNVFPVVNPASP